MNEKCERQMKKGFLDLMILKLLEEKPKYGYQLILEMKERGGDIFVLKEGTLYPVLYRLEDDSLVESAWSVPEGKQMARKYYEITDRGREELSEIIKIWKQISSGIHNILEGNHT